MESNQNKVLTKKCPFCAEEISNDATVCKHCNSNFMKKCPFCAEEISNEAIVCKHCKSKLESVKKGSSTNSTNAQSEENASKLSRTAALLLCIFLGVLGAHRFYAGKTGSGIIILILSISVIGCLISGPWVFIDLIMIITGSFKDRQGKPIINWQ